MTRQNIWRVCASTDACHINHSWKQYTWLIAQGTVFGALVKYTRNGNAFLGQAAFISKNTRTGALNYWLQWRLQKAKSSACTVVGKHEHVRLSRSLKFYDVSSHYARNWINLVHLGNGEVIRNFRVEWVTDRIYCPINSAVMYFLKQNVVWNLTVKLGECASCLNWLAKLGFLVVSPSFSHETKFRFRSMSVSVF